MIYELGLHPAHRDHAKAIIKRLAENKLHLHNISKKQNITALQLKNIVTKTEMDHWLVHCDHCVDNFRRIYGTQNEHIEYPLQNKTRLLVSEKFRRHFAKEVEALLDGMKRREDKLATSVKSINKPTRITVKRR